MNNKIKLKRAFEKYEPYDGSGWGSINEILIYLYSHYEVNVANGDLSHDEMEYYWSLVEEHKDSREKLFL